MRLCPLCRYSARPCSLCAYLRRAGLLLLFLLGSIGIGHAQSQHYIQWDPNPATDNVLYYTLVFNGTAYQVQPTIDGACSCIQQAVTIPSGSNTASVTATNTWGTSAATTLTFNANPAGKVGNVRVK